RGSLGVDVETTIDVTLTDNKVRKIPTNAKGPLVHQECLTGGLLLGRSSAGIKGIVVIPGVIDADYTGIIYTMVYTLNPPIFIPAGSRIAQIIALEIQLPEVSNPPMNIHGNQGFGSMGPAVCFTTTMTQRPMMKLQLSQNNQTVSIIAMLYTGADVTIIN
ncbi:POK9 protein, partial [Alopecoenas beccarii]|nr:POK9 protein [Alopecoenas beccarii]